INNSKKILLKNYGMNITRKEIALEIGSGQDPEPRSDFFLDKYVLDSTERYIGRGVVDTLKFGVNKI
ncbi:MAG: hypothetical protein ACFE8P_05905, partial [Promethearchaeota archaeon]